MQHYPLVSPSLFPLETRLVPAVNLSPAALTSTPPPATDTATLEVVQIGTADDGEGIFSMTYQPRSRPCSCAGCGSLATEPATVAVAAPVVVDPVQSVIPPATAEGPPLSVVSAPAVLPLLMDETLPEVNTPIQFSSAPETGLTLLATPVATDFEELDQVVVSPGETPDTLLTAVSVWEADVFVADEFLA